VQQRQPATSRLSSPLSWLESVSSKDIILEPLFLRCVQWAYASLCPGTLWTMELDPLPVNHYEASLCIHATRQVWLAPPITLK
jgi:hypothetical protein